ncbi:hypothetical protein BKA83DRAFT_4063155, partial [Pisolithus microcarpus]
YLIGPEINSNPYHISVARIHLARNLGLYYPDIKNEVQAAFEDVTAVDAVPETVCRASNTVFIGQPLCRDHDWVDLNSQLAVDVATDANILNMFPPYGPV